MFNVLKLEGNKELMLLNSAIIIWKTRIIQYTMYFELKQIAQFVTRIVYFMYMASRH